MPDNRISGTTDSIGRSIMAEGRITFRIEGMTCQACAARLEKVLNKKDFVHEAAVNFASEEAQIRFDADRADAALLAEAVAKAGFSALPAEAGQPENAETAASGSLKSHWRLWLLLVLALPFVVGMLGMLAGSHALMPPLWYQLAAASAVQLWLALPFYRSACASVRGGLANMDVLVSVGTAAIYLYSLGMVLAGGGHEAVYFEAGVMVVAFVSLGKYLEERTKRGSLNSLGLLLRLTPAETEVRAADGTWQLQPLSAVKASDVLRCTDGGRIAADGVVLAGEAWADESHLTGESEPQRKTAGSRVLAGALLSGSVEYRAEALGGDTLLGDMMRALSEAQGSKAPIARLADKVAAVFVPVVLVLALLTFALTWLFSGSPVTALVHAVAVLVVACPCALGLATPAAIMAGMGAAIGRGVWFKNAAVMERAGRVDTVVLDKTGTLTAGRPQIAALWLAEGVDETLLFQAASAVEQHSRHPLAQALLAAAAERGISPPPASAPYSEAGAGLEADVAGIGRVRVGKSEFCGFRLPENLEGIWQIASVAAVSADGKALGAVAFADTLRPDSAAAVARLQAVGIEVRMMSGDRPAAVAQIATELGLAAAQGAMLPRDKAEAVRQLMAEGRVVAMAGDGINDAPALAAADVGFALKGGTDVAEHSADALLMNGSVGQLADALLVARATLKTIRQNLFFAFFYNVLAIPLAAFGLLSPVIAGAAMALSSVTVLGNALRLKHFARGIR